MAEERFIRSFDGTELFVSRAGSGPPVVLCDGIGCDGFVLRYLRPTLQDRYTFVNWHYRGHGQSAIPDDPEALGIGDLRRDLLAVLDALDIERAVLMGYSMGVQLSLDFALRHPERVVGLVPMCGSYGHPLDTFHDTSIANAAFPYLESLVRKYPHRAQWAWSRLFRSELAFQWGIHFEVEGRLLKREDFEPYFEHLARMDVGVFFRMLDKVRHHSVARRLHEIRVPTLVVAGERDTFTPVWLSRRMQRLISGAEILVVPFGTHTAPLEMPELVCMRVCKFLDEHIQPLFAVDSGRKPKKATGKKATGKKATGNKTTGNKATGKKTTGKKATGKTKAGARSARAVAKP